jgi:hypothetical protein
MTRVFLQGVTALHPDGFECVALLNVLDRCVD